MKKLSKITSVFAVVLVMLCCVSGVAWAENSDSLTIICRKEEVILSNMEWKIFCVADVAKDGSYVPKDVFADYPVSLEDKSVSALREAAGKFETYTIKDDITPLSQGATDENGRLVFSGLETGLYLVAGEPVRVDDMAYVPVPSLIELNEENKDGTAWTYDLTALPKLKVLPAVTLIRSEYTVQKQWLNDSVGVRPESVTAVLYRNGVEFSTALLSEENNWQYVWKDLPRTADWKIEEKNVPEGYAVSYTESEDTVTMTNTWTRITAQTATAESYTPGSNTSGNSTPTASGTTGEKLPQTGMYMWLVPVLGIAGTVLLITGWFICKRSRNEK